MVNMTQPSDDFFSLLEKEQKENNSIGLDEIIFKDQSGKMKVLKDGQVFDYEPKVSLKPQKDDNQNQIPVVSKKNLNLPAVAKKEEVALMKKSESNVSLSPKMEPDTDLDLENKSNLDLSETKVVAKSNLPQMPIRPKRQIILDPSHSSADFINAAQEIIGKIKPDFSDPDLNKRLLNIIVSNLKNIRDRVETKEMLLSSPLKGGVGLDMEVVDKIIEISEIKKSEFFQNKPKKSSDALISLQTEAELLLDQLPVKKIEETRPSAIIKSSSEITADQPRKVSPVLSPKIQEKKPLIGQKDVLPELEKKQNIFKPIARGQEIKAEPIKFTPRLLSPVEEIRTMTLKDFRLLDSDPVNATHKIMKKIELLEEESIVQKVNGIKAWKESQPYRLYLKLGLQAMEEKCSMSEIIARQKSIGQETLTEAELEAIMEFNQKIRY